MSGIKERVSIEYGLANAGRGAGENGPKKTAHIRGHRIVEKKEGNQIEEKANTPKRLRAKRARTEGTNCGCVNESVWDAGGDG